MRGAQARALARVGAVLAAAVVVGLTGAVLVGGASPALATAGDGGVDIPLTVTVPERDASAGGPFTVSDASLRWALNAEAGSGAFYGGCNFLMAGRPGADGDTHGGKVWADATYYHASAGAVHVEKLDASGTYRPVTFADRCRSAGGQTVTTGNGLSTGTQAVLDAGKGRVDPVAGTATIRWTGTFTAVFYGGLTYWWASDPVLTVAADGTGTVTATLGGYGTSMEDTSRWVALPSTTVVLARLSGVSLAAARGFRTVPTYVGTSVSVPDGVTPQAPRTADNATYWGSFPQGFVDFQVATGQSSYWYSSGGQRDAYKVAAPVYVSYDADAPVTVDPGDHPGGTTTGGGPTNTVTERPPGGSAGPAGTGGPEGAAPVAPVPGASAAAVQPGSALAPTVGAPRSLVPTLETPAGRRDAVGYATAGLLLLAAAAVHGFRKGWLVLPLRR
jgi:hypothetical protein